MTPAVAKVAGAPISWGVCEAPGWGHQMAADRVLEEMRAVGLGATEAGPPGFLPADPRRARALLGGEDLGLAGVFVTAVLHGSEERALEEIVEGADWLSRAGGDVLVLAAVESNGGYDARDGLDRDDWARLLHNLDTASKATVEKGLLAVLHPHVGTVVETAGEVDRVLDGTSIPLCLDTGHQLVGGIDPVDLVTRAEDRIRHVHLKDVDAELAQDVRDRRVAYRDAVGRGLYRPLGDGGVDLESVVTGLTANGYRGWFVLEQDVVLGEDPPRRSGPIDDVRRSLAYLELLLSRSKLVVEQGGRE